MRLTVSLPTLTRLSASVTPAIFLSEILERYIAGHPLVALEDLGEELALAVARHLQALDLARRGEEIALVVAVALSSPGGGELR
jgi:hypothetical protein